MAIHKEATGELDARFSASGATTTEWSEALDHLARAEVYWLTTVRRDGSPHQTPLIGVVVDDAVYFCTGPTEQKAKNIEHDARCLLTTGCNTLRDGLDVVVEGEAIAVTDKATLRRVASGYESKYGREWHFDVRDGAFFGEGGRAVVYEITKHKVLGFRKGNYSQTRWRFRSPQPV
jgi:general stress protein 26